MNDRIGLRSSRHMMTTVISTGRDASADDVRLSP